MTWGPCGPQARQQRDMQHGGDEQARCQRPCQQSRLSDLGVMIPGIRSLTPVPGTSKRAEPRTPSPKGWIW